MSLMGRELSVQAGQKQSPGLR